MAIETPAGRRTERFETLIAPHRRELHLHCYRMLGSVADADDLLQETLTAAWRGPDDFGERASLRAWLYRIATNRCLNAIRDAKRRPPPEPVPPFAAPEPSRRADVTWLEPYPEAWLDPAERRESIELAFIAALQRLPPRQTAAVVLWDVLAFGTAEVAEMLAVTPTAVKGLLQRARAALGPPGSAPSAAEQELAQRFAAAFTIDDIDALVALLTDTAWLAMPPAPHEYHGPEAIASFLRTSAAWRAGRRFVLEPTRANRQPAFRCAFEGEPAGIVVLTTHGDRISAIARFLRAPAGA